MTTELTKAAQQAISALRCAKHGHCDHAMADEAITALEALTQRPAAQTEPEAPYGYCPECGAPGVMRERRPDGDDKCSNGHRYPSRSARASLPAPQQATPGWSYTQTRRVDENTVDHGRMVAFADEGATPDPVAEDWRADFDLAAQMLTWGRDDGGLDAAQIKEIDAHAAKMFARLKAHATPEPVGEVVAWWHVNRLGGIQAFTSEPPPSLKAECRPLVFGDTRPAPGVPEDVQRNAARWEEVLRQVGADRQCGGFRFTLYNLRPIPGSNPMQGAVCQHFAQAVDAMLAAAQAKGGEHA